MNELSIKSTSDYSIFKSVTANREVLPRHVKSIANSMKIRNLLWMNPIKVNERFEVIDGQHRLAASELLGSEVHYIVCPGITKADLAVLNSNQRNWSKMDFINFYAIEGLEDFKRVSKLINRFSMFTYSLVLRILGADNGKSNLNPATDIRAGKISLQRQDHAVAIFSRALLIKEATKQSWVISRQFVEAISSMNISDFQTDRIIVCAKKSPYLFVRKSSSAEYKEMIAQLLKS